MAVDVVQRLREYVLTHESEQWIEGWGWDQNKWPEPVFPTAADLGRDPLLKGRAIALSRIDGHAAWVSPAVLALMGTLPETVDGGSILRDAEGNPTAGIFIDNAMDLIPRPPWTEHQIKEYFDATIRTALSFGLTTLHDAGSSPEHISFFKAQADAGKLPIRLYIMGLVSSDEYWGAQIPRLVDYGPQGRLNVRSVKLVTDGALGSWGAALLEPYSDKPEQRGILRQTAEVLAHIIRKFYEDGWQVNIHCIGDFANHLVLDIFENVLLRPDASVYKWRPRIEHAQIMTANDLERVGRLGVIASVQPTHATSDMSYAESRLGSERILGAYAYRTLLNTSRLNIHSPGGGVLPLGSDFPVEPVNPLLGFYAAVTRLDTGGNSPHGSGGWFPSQRLTRAQALKGMTLDAAYAAFAEDQYGSIAVGKRADFVVLDHDIMQVPVADILNTRVVATVIDGEIMYGQLKV
ncbi:amidohydrolase 3 [Fistulina hepatica ATCC 64428]|uniref:Amidohydrolase 3 n=1 Tax=Fistulina hepatica ATCC 64428 TaxID=1128425 RepID=A0A0D7ACX5_9AGAR|nr:amidohydrolase 3 [Fistulina hepatica ATCC 64428]